MVMKKPKDSKIVYQFWKYNKKLYTKPTGQGALWTNENTNTYPNEGHLFVYGEPLNQDMSGRSLIKLEGVDASGGESDGHIDYDVENEEAALKKILEYKNPNVAYSYCRQSLRLIQKPPEKRIGNWVENDNALFMFVDKALGTNGEKFFYQRIQISQFDDIFGIVCAQRWESTSGKTITFKKDGKGTSVDLNN